MPKSSRSKSDDSADIARQAQAMIDMERSGSITINQLIPETISVNQGLNNALVPHFRGVIKTPVGYRWVTLAEWLRNHFVEAREKKKNGQLKGGRAARPDYALNAYEHQKQRIGSILRETRNVFDLALDPDFRSVAEAMALTNQQLYHQRIADIDREIRELQGQGPAQVVAIASR